MKMFKVDICLVKTDDQAPFAYLLLEMLPGVTLDAAPMSRDERRYFECNFAEEILKLHANKGDDFSEIGGRFTTKKWGDIIVPRLLEMREEMEGSLQMTVLANIDTALALAKAVFSESQSVPTLIHGDLWAGNILVDKVKGGWQLSGLIDPGTQYADAEHELAYLQCYSTVGKMFFETYFSCNPMRPGFDLRKLYYWLNTMMIHVWLFDKPEYRYRTAEIAAEIVERR